MVSGNNLWGKILTVVEGLKTALAGCRGRNGVHASAVNLRLMTKLIVE